MEQSRLTKALDERFTDIEEIRDVADYGCSGGVPDFIYYYETRKFFNEYEEEIEQELWNMYGDDWFAQVAKLPSITDTMQFKNHCVWLIVETYCIAKVEERAEQEYQAVEEAANCEWKDGKIISNEDLFGEPITGYSL